MAKHIDKADELIEKDNPVLARAELETATFLDKLPQGDWKIHWLMARSYLKELPYTNGRKVLLNLAYDQMTKALSSFRYAGNDVVQENKIMCLACIGWICMLKKDYPGAVYHLLVAKKEADELKKKADELNKEADELKKRPNELKKKADELNKEADELKKKSTAFKPRVSFLLGLAYLKHKLYDQSKSEFDKLEIPTSSNGKNEFKCSSVICSDPEEFKIDSDGLLHIYTCIYKLFPDLEQYVNIEDTWTRLNKINTDNKIVEKGDKLVESHLEHCRGWWLLDKCILEDKTHDDDHRIINVSIGNLYEKIEKIVIIDGELTNFENLEISCNETTTLKNAKIKNFKIQDLKVKEKERHLIVDVEEATIKKAQVECMQYSCDKSDQKELCTLSKHLKLKQTVLQDVEFEEKSIKGIKIHRESMVNLAVERLQKSLGFRADHYAYLHLAQAHELQMTCENDGAKKAIIKKRAMDACQRCIDLDHYEEHIKEAQDMMKRLEGSQSASSPPQQAKKEEDKAKGEGAEKAGLTASSEVKKTGG